MPAVVYGKIKAKVLPIQDERGKDHYHISATGAVNIHPWEIKPVYSNIVRPSGLYLEVRNLLSAFPNNIVNVSSEVEGRLARRFRQLASIHNMRVDGDMKERRARKRLGYSSVIDEAAS